MNRQQWDEIRWRVYERDMHTCQICGAQDVMVHADHIVPRGKGKDGSDNLSNLQTLCGVCHALKTGYGAPTYYLLAACLLLLGFEPHGAGKDGSPSFDSNLIEGQWLQFENTSITIGDLKATIALPVGRCDEQHNVVRVISKDIFQKIVHSWETECVTRPLRWG